jgi:HPt (histidine-containing phosphotransfer) domain-containing protein
VKTAPSTLDATVAALLPAFLQHRREDAQLLETALAAADYPAVAAVGHRLKGLGSTYGFDAISECGRAFEAAAAARDADMAQRTMQRYAAFLASLA